MKVALVTGASKGIGAAVAADLAQRGYAVVGCAREEAPLAERFDALRGEGLRLDARRCDVASEPSVEALFEYIDQIYGRIDVLINNAGVFERAPLEQMTAEQFDRVMAVNVRGVFLCSRAAFRRMGQQADGGDIVNVSSLSGVKGVEKFAGTSAYVASKYAVAGLTEQLAAEGKPRQIRVKAVSPGAVATEMLNRTGTGLRAGIDAAQLAAIIGFLVSDAGRPLSGSNVEIFSNG